MSGKQSIAESIALGERMRQHIEASDAEMERLPATATARVHYELDKQIVRAHGSPFDWETEMAVGLFRQREAQNPPRRLTRAEEDRVAMAELELEVRRDVSKASRFDKSVVGFDEAMKSKHMQPQGNAEPEGDYFHYLEAEVRRSAARDGLEDLKGGVE